MLSASDLAHLELATAQQRVIFTQDADFIRLHEKGIGHAGIVYMPQQTPVGYILRHLMLVYDLLESAEMHDHIEFL